jgi:putative transposase
MGELKKLGITPPSRNTVKNILKANGLEPGPKRGAGTWDEFLKIHAATLWQCDFYSKKVMTLKGLRDLYLLIFLHVETRRVFIAPATYHPNEAWVKEQGEAFLRHAKETGLGTTLVMHDRDTKFTASFDDVLKAGGLKIQEAAYRSPNTNAFVERFIQTLQQECLDYFVVFGEKHMNHLVSEMVVHYHEERPHQAKENETLLRESQKRCKKRGSPSSDVVPLRNIKCRQRLGGLLKHYERRAA